MFRRRTDLRGIGWRRCWPVRCGRFPCWATSRPRPGAEAGRYAAAAPGGDSQESVYQRPVRVAERSRPWPRRRRPAGCVPAIPTSIRSMPCLRWAREGLSTSRRSRTTRPRVVKRERIGGKLGDYEYMFVKMRHKPFSVYMYFLGPAAIKGQEVIYVDGPNNGKMWAHGVGMQETMFGTVSLEPDGVMAMRGERYPLTEMGILNLTRRLIEVAEQDTKYGECEVKFFKGAKINNRVCTCIQVIHPMPRRNFLFHLAQDLRRRRTQRARSATRPTNGRREPGGAPELIEEYTYLNLKLNNGFTDADFDTHNPNYQLPR